MPGLDSNCLPVQQRLETADQSLNKEPHKSLIGLEAEAGDGTVVTGDRTAHSDKVFTLSGLIPIERKFIKGMIDCCCG